MLDVGIHVDRQVRPNAAAQHGVEAQHRVAAELSSSTLIGFGGIGEAVAQHPLAAGERRFDHLRELLGAGSEHERHLSHGIEALGARVEQHSANALANLGSAGLASGEHINAFRAQHLRQLPQLSGFAAAVEAFEGDELAAHGRMAHAAIISSRLGRPSRATDKRRRVILLIAHQRGIVA
jgi:hypothetical protein